MKISDEEIKDGLDQAYKDAGHNAYFGNGFDAGVRFALKYINTVCHKTSCGYNKLHRCTSGSRNACTTLQTRL